MSETCRGHLWE